MHGSITCEAGPSRPLRANTDVTDAELLSSLPPLSTLQTWVHRPQAIAACTVGDVFGLRTLVQWNQGVTVRSPDVFLLDRFPCKVVHIVGWVASVDVKESKMFVTIDGGDGQYLISAQIALQLQPSVSSRTTALKPAAFPSKNVTTTTNINSSTAPSPPRRVFVSAKDRKAQRKAAELQAEEEKQSRQPVKVQRDNESRVYVKRDIRVGDTVRVVGKVDEFMRTNVEGKEWVRRLWVDESSGGSIEVVHPDEQFIHYARVLELRKEVYSRPFEMPVLDVTTIPLSTTRAPPSAPATPIPMKRAIRGMTTPNKPSMPIYISPPGRKRAYSISIAYSDGLDMESTMASEISMDGDGGDAALPDVRSLRSSQLTDQTFRRYLLDYMVEEVRSSIAMLSMSGAVALDYALHELFPEYTVGGKGADKARESRSTTYGHRHDQTGPATPLREIQPSAVTRNGRSHANQDRDAITIIDSDEDTPKPKRTLSQLSTNDTSFSISTNTTHSLLGMTTSIPSFSLTELIAVPHLAELAGMIVDNVAKRDERRRRRRIRDNEASEKDYHIERERIRLGKGPNEYRLSERDRRKNVEKMVRWSVCAISEEGGMVQVTKPRVGCVNGGCIKCPSQISQIRTTSNHRCVCPPSSDEAYIPICASLLLPILVRLLDNEQARRRRVFVRPSERVDGMTIPALARALGEWGEEGRWERVAQAEMGVEDAIMWGLERGRVRREGKGFWGVEG